ncbi:DnaB-like helicase N-terminal domain-containing protein [Isoptericola dokdonensis]|uniref:DnaB-like helicase N-terminal domain-containing protein n=1 Tax=Isoptericola dokdonensis TaxID=372663 RepID=UPI000B0CF8C7|nr:DnaB-like helicase N-terminal domain-containing protein [Isoptericola dokdonensis]
MSIDELEAGYGSSSGAAFDRTPPQDIDAEMSVLGGMLLSKDAIADVVEQIRGNDFYRPAHEAVYDAIVDLYGRGEPADAITVVAELTKRGEIGRIGGASYIHDLMAGVPTAANAGYYARIVQERAVLRRLVAAGTKIVQLGYATDGGDVDAVVNNAQAEIYAVTERKTSEDYMPLADIIGGTMDEIEAAGNRGEGMTGVPTGFADLDRLTNGLHPGQMIVIAARPAMGKALALDTPCPRRRAGPPWVTSPSATSWSPSTGRRRASCGRPRSCPAAPATRSSSTTARPSSRTPGTSGRPAPPAIQPTSRSAPPRTSSRQCVTVSHTPSPGTTPPGRSSTSAPWSPSPYAASRSTTRRTSTSRRTPASRRTTRPSRSTSPVLPPSRTRRRPSSSPWR